MQCSAFHAGHELHQTGVADIQDQPIDDLVTEIAVSHLSPFEAQGSLNLIALAKKAHSLVFLGLIVMLIHRDRELDLFDDDDLLFLAGRAVALILFVKELAVILDLTDRRNSVRRDLYEIERSLAGHLEGVKRSHDAELFAVFVDDANLAGADAFIGADK